MKSIYITEAKAFHLGTHLNFFLFSIGDHVDFILINDKKHHIYFRLYLYIINLYLDAADYSDRCALKGLENNVEKTYFHTIPSNSRKNSMLSPRNQLPLL